MKSKLAFWGIMVMFFAGAALMSYPLVSSAINNYVSRSRVREYTETVALMHDEEAEKLIDEAKEYNRSLLNKSIVTSEQETDHADIAYEEILKINENGLIGYIDIPKINVYLPIYHGTDKEVLAKGTGHLKSSSFPVGGESTHAVITAHTAFPGETFFDYLTDMEIGDVFYIHILDRTIKYQVDQIEVVLPEDMELLEIEEGKDLVTLFTCTPYSINTHRLLVRGERVEYDDTEYVETGISLAKIDDSGIFFLGYRISYIGAALILLLVVGIGFEVFCLIALKQRPRRKSKKRSSKKM